MKKLALFALGLMLVFAMGVYAADDNKEVMKKVGEGVVEISFDKTPFVDAVKQLGEKLGVKMVVDDSIKDTVKDVKLSKAGKDIPVRMLLMWMCKEAGVTHVVKDGAVVFTKGEAKGMGGM